MKLPAIIVFLFLFASGNSLAQTGVISGVVHDEGNGEELVGANVLIVGTTKGASTDLDGRYVIQNVEPGKYDLRISYVGYETKVVTDVAARDGETVEINVNLQSSTYTAEEVIVTAERVLSSEAAVLADRKKAATIGDGISAEQMKRTPDATSADALKRVTGLSVVDNKFVFIRGVTDRYNETMLDGAPVTSTEAGKKGFSFDLVPSNLLENSVVVKSATPDLPGNFTGGLVQLNTLDFPTRRVLKLSLSSAYNSLTTSKSILTSQGGSRDWLGFDDGTRDFVPARPDLLTTAQELPNNWAPERQKAPFNGSVSLAYGDKIMVNEEDPSSSQMGFISALSYKNGFQRNSRTINDTEVGRYCVGTKDDYSVLWGAIANIGYKFGGLHKISLKNSYNQSADDEVSSYLSEDISTSLLNQYTIVSWTQRSSYSGQLVGEHRLPALGGMDIQWRATVASSRRSDPDRKEVTYFRNLGSPTQPFSAATNQRSWSHLNDRSLSFAPDITLPVSTGKIKLGAVIERKTTNYMIRYFNIRPDFGIPDSLTQMPIDKIYDPQNYGRRKFLFEESTKATDSYEGEQTLYAGYLMADLPFTVAEQDFRIAGGTRIENSDQIVTVPRTLVPDGPTDRNSLKNVDILPSANLTYLINNITNIRLAYMESVNRPEFRERAPIIYNNFITNTIEAGNPNLTRSYIHNYDVRLEIFPDIGELFAISYFYKTISGAIEKKLEQTAVRTETLFNSDRARNYGWELEFRKNLGFLGGYFKNFLITGNYTRIQSSVTFDLVQGNSTNTVVVRAARPMQEQSPYMINLSLLFTEPDLGTAVSILYNKFGRRLETVGFLASDIYEEPQDLIDISVTKSLFAGFEGKFTVKNLNNKARILTRDGLIYNQTSIGTTYSLQLSLTM
jgi:CarboxypepD_reg-like domain/TonB dependent receptor-like, beta-barrel/TonB-dependent Receptor Plug Domain